MRPTRPTFPGYGIATDAEGLLPWSWAVERLTASRNYWISTVRANGRPHAMPVWGVVVDETLWFGTGGVKRRNLLRDPRLVAHAESGDEVVILEGRVEEVPLGEDVRDAYAAKYDHRPEQERFWVVRPDVAFAWVEHAYPRTATKFLPA